jgi:hypothetical protein
MNGSVFCSPLIRAFQPARRRWPPAAGRLHRLAPARRGCVRSFMVVTSFMVKCPLRFTVGDL